MEDNDTYEIVRFYAPDQKKESEVIKTGLSLEEAQDHCSDPDTKCREYFDGYRKE